MRFSNNNTTWSTWEAYATSKAWTLSSGDGTKSVYVQYRDNAGNISTTIIKDTIKLDTTKPVVSEVNDTPDPFIHHEGGVSTIGFTVSDNLAGTCKIELKIYDAANSLVRKIIKTGVSCPSGGYTGSVTWDGKGSLTYNGGALVPGGASYIYKLRAQDKALNWSAVKSVAVNVQ